MSVQKVHKTKRLDQHNSSMEAVAMNYPLHFASTWEKYNRHWVLDWSVLKNPNPMWRQWTFLCGLLQWRIASLPSYLWCIHFLSELQQTPPQSINTSQPYGIKSDIVHVNSKNNLGQLQGPAALIGAPRDQYYEYWWFQYNHYHICLMKYKL